MSTSDNWEQGNARYLSAAVAWLRACLERAVGADVGPSMPLPATVVEHHPSFWSRLVQGPSEPQAATGHLLPAAGSGASNDRVANAAAELQKAESQVDPPPALVSLSKRLGLSSFEQQVLLLCVGTELDTSLAGLCARAQGDPQRAYPTFALAFSIFDDPAWEALSPERPLRHWRLLEINQPNGQALTTSPLRADERIVNYAKGLNYLDDRIVPLLTPLRQDVNAPSLPTSHSSIVEKVVSHVQQVAAGSLPIIHLLGGDPASKYLIATHIAGNLGLKVFRLSTALLPSLASDLEMLTRLWQRETLLLPIALYLDTQSSSEAPAGSAASPLVRLLERIEGVTFLDTQDAWPGLMRSTLPVDVAKPSAAEQTAAWQKALGDSAAKSPSLLSAQFNLSLATLHEVAQRAISRKDSDPRDLHDLLWEGCVASTSPRLDSLAQRIEPKATWDDIVLPAAENNLLHQIAEQVGERATVYGKWGFGARMSRGLGISALFAGESGTGKTMAAEVLANHLRLNLYRIDLSAVVSKYIGETEKNLRRLFDAAEDGGAILFFDEADALFGKRSEVKDSHDRFANIEINYLLQRMEAYRGLAILATNMKSALDAAFLRRLRFVVNFPFPGLTERKAIWQKVFPSDTPTGVLDWDRLARLNLTGGHIHNIALNAAFRAAHASESVSMPLVLDAARTELRKLERPINEMDFRWQVKPGAVA
jgi:ATPase family associated with various cellular activities (AAA)